jgi:hypothetical protein
VISEDPSGQAQKERRRRGFNSVAPKPIFERFRDFKHEAKLREQQSQGLGLGSGVPNRERKITELFIPPYDLLLDSSFAEVP